jgi:hypothetical protein
LPQNASTALYTRDSPLYNTRIERIDIRGLITLEGKCDRWPTGGTHSDKCSASTPPYPGNPVPVLSRDIDVRLGFNARRNVDAK